MSGEYLRAAEGLPPASDFMGIIRQEQQRIVATATIGQMRRWPGRVPTVVGSGRLLQDYDSARKSGAEDPDLMGIEVRMVNLFGRSASVVYTEWQRQEPRRQPA